MSKRKTPTMYDVARLAGVSQKTVSRVFNNEPFVGEKTREKVLNAAAELEFTPNVAARRLAGTKTYVIGLVFHSDIDLVSTSGGFISQLTHAALMKCHQEGYGLLLQSCGVDAVEDHRTLAQLATSGSVDGLILVPPLADSRELLDLLDSKNIKYIECFSSRSANSAVPYVAADDYKGARDLTHLLLRQGHRRIAYVAGVPSHQSSIDRRRGFEDACREAGVAAEPELIIQGAFNYESGIACARHLLALTPRPTAIMSFNDDVASGVLTVAHQMALNIPGDLSIAGFDDAGIATQLWPPLTTVRQPIGDIITLAIDLLIKSLRGESDEIGSIVLPVKTIERESVGPPRSSSI